MKILYVENSLFFAAYACQELLAAHVVQVVPTVAEARHALRANDYDLVIVDYDLDDGKGDEFVSACRLLRPNLKIIAGSSHEAGNKALVKAGACAVCAKKEFDSIQSVIDNLGPGA